MSHPYTGGLVTRFWAKVNKQGKKECWPWTACIYKNTGYGRLSLYQPKCVLAHRVSYQVHHNVTLTSDVVIRHQCDNKICQNPHHMLTGTLADNIADCVSRGRQARGEKNRNAKITEEIVRKIRAEYLPYRVTCTDLGIKYGLSMNQVWLIVKRQQWRHIQ